LCRCLLEWRWSSIFTIKYNFRRVGESIEVARGRLGALQAYLEKAKVE